MNAHFHPPGARARRRRPRPRPHRLLAPATRTPQRERRQTDGEPQRHPQPAAAPSSQEAAQAAWRAGFQDRQPRRHRQLRPDRLRRWPRAVHQRRLSRSPAPTPTSPTRRASSSAPTERCGGDAIEVPNYVSPIAVIYNLEGVDELNLSPETLAGIFDGKITTWDDPAIAEDNPDADLPGRDDHPGPPLRRVGHDRATSPTTSARSRDGALAVRRGRACGRSTRGEGAKGTSGVVVRGHRTAPTPSGTPTPARPATSASANIEVGEEFVAPTAEAAAKILEVSPRAEGRSDDRHGLRPRLQHRGGRHLPDRATSYLIACPDLRRRRARATLVKGYLSYIVSDEGQQAAAENAGSAPLPAALRRGGPGHRRGHLGRRSDVRAASGRPSGHDVPDAGHRCGRTAERQPR